MSAQSLIPSLVEMSCLEFSSWLSSEVTVWVGPVSTFFIGLFVVANVIVMVFH